jgi:hypothetical protein
MTEFDDPFQTSVFSGTGSIHVRARAGPAPPRNQ